MKASKHNDSNLIWESYNKKLSEGTDGNTDDLTEREKMKLAAHAAKKGKGPLAKEEDDEVNEASHDNRSKEELDAEKKDLDNQDQKHFRVPKDHKKKKIEDAEKSVKENVVEEEMYDCVRDYMSDGYSRSEAEKMCSGRGYEESAGGGMTSDALARSEQDNPEFEQDTWILMKGDPASNTVKAIKKYTGVNDEGSVQQLATMLADLTAEQDGLPRDEQFPFETDTGFEYFELEIPDGTKLKRVIAIDEDYDLICVAPDDNYMMDELGR